MFDGQLNVPTWTLKNFDDFIPFLLKRMIIGLWNVLRHLQSLFYSVILSEAPED